MYFFVLILCTGLKWGVPPGGGNGCRGGLLFFVGAFGRYLSQISHRKLKISISHSPILYDWEKIFMLRLTRLINKIDKLKLYKILLYLSIVLDANPWPGYLRARRSARAKAETQNFCRSPTYSQ